ncbi:uncharacterized protein SPPG_04467 [Spizellomyces punctatus DAOM BR117]|uniref:Uncharacterized protein n=1 Tax=Spizellomyces punctatus (strain DAOM BR117) TaxID=645134 RepID=A0A0L0HGY2_SPIPD|nr:uncharacterized protein SPPG_04467 [Spizellomyces punctatus DAOM BR117]KND00125.1 hypothetical protein SPPG_04467 [Spizellomyces punctatus DAOM BR117]|eukprot:XP_016608164.1 hypothetical protein SPPG_04467 [Spizellomyces punctatus DAOM BR117]
MAEDYLMGNGAYGDHIDGANGRDMQKYDGDAAKDPNADEVPQQSDWERLWDAVSKNPDDFESWEYLIAAAEGANGDVTKNSSAEDQQNLRTVYDHFLLKFPLCFGYWKKYADRENALEGPEKAQEIFERGVVSIHNSVDLWTQYCTFKIENFAIDETGIRSLFERGADAVGYDFMSHVFWDKYIAYEESKGNSAGIMAILERIIHIPLHQYARYFESYSTLSITRPVRELVSAEEYANLEDEIRNPPKQEDDDRAPPEHKTDDQVQAEMRQRIHAIKSELYMKTQDAVHKRWIYESEIKRPYFHVKPLDEAQLANWRRYLEFEESEGDQMRIYVLYERCLVACALYEEFWKRYIQFLLAREDFEGARNVYIRATNIFIPSSRPSVRLSYAAFEEERGRIEEARQIYTQVLTQLPGHLETLTKFAHFERRQGSQEKAIEVLDNGIQSARDTKSKGFLEAKKLKCKYNADGDIEAARAAYQDATQKYSDSRFLWLSYLLLEVAQPGPKALNLVAQIWEGVKASSLPAEDKRDLGLRYLDFLLERSTDIALINKVELTVHRDYASHGETSRKRGFEDDSEYRPIKQARASVDVSGVAPVDVGTPTTPYYAPQAQAAYNPYAAYGAQQGYAGGYYGAAPAAGAPQQGWDYSQQPAAAY